MTARPTHHVLEDALRYAPPSSFQDEELHYVRAAMRARLNRLEESVAFLSEQCDTVGRYILALTETIEDRQVEAPF